MGFAIKDAKDSVAEESSVLQVARDLFFKLGNVDDIPHSVVWVAGAYQPDKPALLRKHRLGLRDELRGKLSPDEWRPLLASSLLLYTKMRKRRLMLESVVPLLSMLVGGLLIYLLWAPVLSLIHHTGSRGDASALVLFIGVFFGFGWITGPFRRKLRFRADEIVSREFGMKEELLESLRKIDNMSVVDTGRFSNPLRQATIAQRIENLLRMSG